METDQVDLSLEPAPETAKDNSVEIVKNEPSNEEKSEKKIFTIDTMDSTDIESAQSESDLDSAPPADFNGDPSEDSDSDDEKPTLSLQPDPLKKFNRLE